MRAAGLMPDGPVTWGQPVRSRAPGIFVVELTAGTESAPIDSRAVLAWLQRAPGLLLDGERPAQSALAARLASFWLPRQRVLYVGRTSKSLGGRVGAAYATRLGDRKPHPGGHWLKTLRASTGCASGGPRRRRPRSTRTPCWRCSPRACRSRTAARCPRACRCCRGPCWRRPPASGARPASPTRSATRARRWTARPRPRGRRRPRLPRRRPGARPPRQPPRPARVRCPSGAPRGSGAQPRTAAGPRPTRPT